MLREWLKGSGERERERERERICTSSVIVIFQSCEMYHHEPQTLKPYRISTTFESQRCGRSAGASSTPTGLLLSALGPACYAESCSNQAGIKPSCPTTSHPSASSRTDVWALGRARPFLPRSGSVDLKMKASGGHQRYFNLWENMAGSTSSPSWVDWSLWSPKPCRSLPGTQLFRW